MLTDETQQPRWRVGVDTGGTFTDLVLLDPRGRIAAACKLLSTPDDPGRAVLAGIDRLLHLYEAAGPGRPAVSEVVHGSTVATNALLEGRGDPAALITTAGFEDLLQLARQDRPELYALVPRRPDPPIRRDRVVGVAERVGYDGSALLALTDGEVARVVEQIKQLNVASAAICLLHSYANNAHERALADAIRRQLPAVHLTVSSELLPEMREYERAATCAVNAVVGPTMSRYVGALDRALGERRLRIMGTGGGTLPPRVVGERPVETVMSGPAGGVIGAWASAQHAGEDRIIGLDMGGTSTDVALCDRGPTRTTGTTINQLPIKLNVIDIHTVGAGGGSIAWIDAGGALRVGPRSAGADPGPACYGRQHDRSDDDLLATVTDAHAVLGHIADGRALGESLRVDRGAAERAVGVIARKLNLSVAAAAEGVLRVADAAMARAIQRVSVQRGHDARAFTLVAFGGAGGLHACRLAKLLGMTRVLIPRHGGLLSALGMLAAPPRYGFSQAVVCTIEQARGAYPDPLQHDAVTHALNQLDERARRALTDDGVAPGGQALLAQLDLRFAGQSYEITVPVDHHRPVIDRFLDEHRRLYGYAPGGRPIEVVAARIEATGPTPTLDLTHNTGDARAAAAHGVLPIIIHEAEQQWPRYSRDALTPGAQLPGPMIIEEYAATAVVPHGWSVEVLGDGQVLLQQNGCLLGATDKRSLSV